MLKANVVVVIAPDEQITIYEIGTQFRPAFGHLVAAALRKLTFSKDDTLTIQSHPMRTMRPLDPLSG